jgi:FkbM family methyltransferase
MADHIYDIQFATNEFQVAGETQLQKKLSDKYELKTFFDVGANIGEWTRMVHNHHFKSEIHLFEPVPETYRGLLNNDIQNGQTILNGFGLSNETGTIDINYSADNDRLSSPVLELWRPDGKLIPVLMMSGDDYCKSRQIESIDFLKIDTEGWEYKVLQGFSDMISRGKISIIQFEYGYANVLTKDLLIDFYKLLQPLGYSIGKLTPEGVHFKEYNLLDEDFRGPNYVAVHQSSPDFFYELQVI